MADRHDSSLELASVRTLANRPLPIVTACRACDLPILEIAARKLQELVPFRSLHVVAPDQDVRKIASRLGKQASVIAEDDFIPDMTIRRLRELDGPCFPRAAGWYFQQLLKLQFAFTEPEEDYYLIWDGDTIPLRPMHFFDDAGKMLLTKATEYHAPYFETYRRLFGAEANYKFSFIAQHMLVQKSVAREMLGAIERRIAGNEHWAWKIMRSLPNIGDNLFSEYETYGNYVKNHYPDRIALVDRTWQREFKPGFSRGVPSEKEMATLAEKFDYVAFEKSSKSWRRLLQRLLRGREG